MEGLVLTPWVDLGVWSKGQNSTFSEHGHAAYQMIYSTTDTQSYLLNRRLDDGGSGLKLNDGSDVKL